MVVSCYDTACRSQWLHEPKSPLAWGTCPHYLLTNEGTIETPEMGTVGIFPDAAGTTPVEPSPIMPPGSLYPSNINPAWKHMTSGWDSLL